MPSCQEAFMCLLSAIPLLSSTPWFHSIGHSLALLRESLITEILRNCNLNFVNRHMVGPQEMLLDGDVSVCNMGTIKRGGTGHCSESRIVSASKKPREH